MMMMMKVSARLTCCCVVLFLALTSVSAVRKIKSIDGLKHIDFGQSVPEHSLLLLHWFANKIDIDRSNVMWLTFDPDSGDYGSHPYNNHERLLDSLPNGYQYYTVGNLNQDTSEPFPWYVTDPPTENEGDNRDRIIIRVREQNLGWRISWRVDRVYITQHYEGQWSRYDPAHTYIITTNLLRQIREFSVGGNWLSLIYLRGHFGSNADDYLLQDLGELWGEFACVGLLLFIVIQEGHYRNRRNNRPQPVVKGNTPPATTITIPEDRHNPRQNHRNADRSNICTCVIGCILVLIIIIVVLCIISFLERRR